MDEKGTSARRSGSRPTTTTRRRRSIRAVDGACRELLAEPVADQRVSALAPSTGSSVRPHRLGDQPLARGRRVDLSGWLSESTPATPSSRNGISGRSLRPASSG